MSDVKAVIESKGGEVHTISPTSTVFDAVCKMVQLNLGALVVASEAGVIGIISERDYLRKIAVEGRSSKSTFVQEIMTPRPICVAPDTQAAACMKLMAKHRIRHLPVMEDGELVGMLSIRDIVDHLAAEREQTIEELTHYIQGVHA
jgi:CBS domain-containing protein